METYAYTNPLIKVLFIDPDRQPALARQYEVRNYGTVVLESKGKTVNAPSAGEEEITGAFLRLLQTRTKRIGFLTGHGEKGPQETDKSGYSMAKGILEKENYKVEEVNLLTRRGVPEGIDCLIVPGPVKPLFPEEIEDLKKFVSDGGRLMVLLEPFEDGGFKDWLASLAVQLKQDMIIDKLSRIFGGDFLIPMAGSYGQHPITEKFKIPTFFPTARSLELSTPAGGVGHDILVRTSSESWAETNKAALQAGEAGFDPGKDRKGPLNLAVLITQPAPTQPAPEKAKGKEEEVLPPRKGKIVVFGDADFASNGFFNMAGNGDLFLNTINHLTEEEQLISIRPTKSQVKPLFLSAKQARVLMGISLGVLPLLVILAGAAVWRVRRKAR